MLLFTILTLDLTIFIYFRAKLCEKLKMKMIAEIPYISYVGMNMLPVFSPPPPHNAVKIYIDDNPQVTTAISIAKK